MASALTVNGRVRLSDRYTAPSMPTSQTVSESRRLPGLIPGVATARDVMLPRGRGRWANPVLRSVAQVPWLRDHRPSLTLLTFGSGTAVDGGNEFAAPNA